MESTGITCSCLALLQCYRNTFLGLCWSCPWCVGLQQLLSPKPWTLRASGFALAAPDLLMLVGNPIWGQAPAVFSPQLCPAGRERDRKHCFWFEKLHWDFCLWFVLVLFYSVKFCVLYPFFPPERYKDSAELLSEPLWIYQNWGYVCSV